MLTRREFGLASAAQAVGAQTGGRRRPNVIVMLTDDMGYQDLGCTGSTYIKTPHIDRMAAEGVRATQWYSNAPVCAPSRGALLTGRYPARNGVVTNGNELTPGEKSIADLLQPAGYATGMAGKWHLGSTATTAPNAHGFDSFFGFHSGCIDFFSHRFYWGEPKTVNYHDLWRNREEVFEDGAYFTDLVKREALGFIERNKAKPFFLYLPFNAPHYPMHATEKYLTRFKDLPLEQRVRAAMIAAVDDTVGEIRGLLGKLGLLRDTLIFFSSDNGATREPRGGLGSRPPEAGSNQPFRGYKFSLFDGGIHLPAIWSWPGTLPTGRLYHGLGAHMDVLPTVCAAAGVALPAGRTYDGRDQLAALKGGEPPHQTLFWWNGPQSAVRHGNWKLVVSGAEFNFADNRGYDPLKGEDAEFLSDLGSDPGETQNLRRARPEIAADLGQRLERWKTEVTAP